MITKNERAGMVRGFWRKKGARGEKVSETEFEEVLFDEGVAEVLARGGLEEEEQRAQRALERRSVDSVLLRKLLRPLCGQTTDT